MVTLHCLCTYNWGFSHSILILGKANIYYLHVKCKPQEFTKTRTWKGGISQWIETIHINCLKFTDLMASPYTDMKSTFWFKTKVVWNQNEGKPEKRREKEWSSNWYSSNNGQSCCRLKVLLCPQQEQIMSLNKSPLIIVHNIFKMHTVQRASRHKRK